MKVVLILSGGLDSSVLLARLLADRHEVHALSVDYGQRHRRELDAAREIAAHYGVEHRVADLSGLRPLLAGSSQTDASVPVPHGHYAEESMKATVVPNRNMLLLGAAGAWAISLKADAVAYGAHAGDHSIYPDCRPEFVAALEKALLLADWHPVRILRPFITLTKADIARLGHKLGVPMGLTWSCYSGEEVHCGACGTCCERLLAFREAGVPDPTVYRDPEFALALTAPATA
jgi:7-cyano-7-deazaguanine synthase